MRPQRMTLDTGITLYPRVFTTSYEVEVMIERFYVPKETAVSRLLNTCHFTLVVRNPHDDTEEIELSIVLTSYKSLIEMLVSMVPDGYELSHGAYWSPTPTWEEKNREEEA